MITKLLNEVNKNIETLNNLVEDKEYFEKLDERIEKVNNYVQEQKEENKRLNNIIKEIREYAEEIIDFVGDVGWVEIPSEDYIKKWQDILDILDKGEQRWRKIN